MTVKIKKLLKKIIPKKIINFIQRFILPRLVRYDMTLTDTQREKRLDKKYYSAVNKHMNFENPVLFTEKTQWYKLYYDYPDLSRIVCKYNFKKYVAEKLGSDKYTIPLYGAWTSVDDIDWDSLPDKLVFKSNCYFGGMNIKIIKDKSAVDWKKLKEEMRYWLEPQNTLINSMCRAYYDVTPMIIAEEYMEQLDNQLYDYKFCCFNGKVHYALGIMNRFNNGNFPVTYYDMDWNKLDVHQNKHPICDIDKPKHFDEMIELSEKLSKDFPFVRVDFFETEEHVYLSEMTFYPGDYSNCYEPESFDKELGDLFILPPKSPLGRKHRKDLKI